MRFLRRLAWFLLFMAMLAAGGYYWWQRQSDQLIETFKTSAIQNSFISYATQLASGKRLQFAELKQMETFSLTSSARIFWEKMELPDIVVSANAPVHYIYYLDLEEPWHFDFVKGKLQVKAPPIRFNPPAVDVSKIQYEVKKGSIFRSSDKALEKLRQGISPWVLQRAEENIHLVTEVGRKKVEEFIVQWILHSGREMDKIPPIEISFADPKNAVAVPHSEFSPKPASSQELGQESRESQ